MTNENKPTIELGKQYQTRDGHEVRIYAVDGNADYPVHGAVLYDYGWSPTFWTLDGINGLISALNLIEIKPKRKIEFWVNVYEGDAILSCLHKTRTEADAHAHISRTECLHFTREYEEGEGL